MKFLPKSAWIPGLFFLLGVLGILALYSMVKTSDRERIQLETQITAEQIRIRLEAWIDARMALVVHLAEGHFADADGVERDFVAEAAKIVDLDPGYQALNFIAPDQVIRIVYPEAPNQDALGKDPG